MPAITGILFVNPLANNVLGSSGRRAFLTRLSTTGTARRGK